MMVVEKLAYSSEYLVVVENKNPDNYIVRMGRLDGDKSPHYAILAAKRLGIPLCILGKPLYDMNYYRKHESLFSDPIVRRLGVLSGQEKMNVLSNAICGIYTTGEEYIEASGGVLSEMLRSGLPIAGISRRPGTAVLEAVNKEYMGKITLVAGMTDDDIVDAICDNVRYCFNLDRKKVFLEANKRYDPSLLLEEMLRKVGD